MTEVNVEHWKRANQVYEQLMDLTVSDALSQLGQMTGVDDQIKSLVLTLISTGSQPSQYFNQQVQANLQLGSQTEFQYKIGDVIGGYELKEELGVGGMARVFRALKVDAQSQKPVAIKLFNNPSQSAIMLDRFALEQDVLAGLSHPHIVNMHHGGSTAEGVPFMVMELIENGVDIDAYVAANRTPLKQKVQWIIDAARAIAYAHNNLIIHRDIKPSNVLIDENQQLKVVDFGIAKLMTKVDAPQKTTIMALTPSFAAPEQINSGQISVTTDIFSLGAVCLALIIEDQPLPADRLLKSCSEDELHVRRLLREKVKDKDLRNILNQALQQEPHHRYRNMDAFADDLSAWLDDKPVQATPDSWLYRIRKFAQRRSALFASLVTLLVTVGLSMGLLTRQYNKTVEEAEKTKIEAKKANQVEDFMLNVFSVVNPDEAQGENILAKDLLSQALVEIEQQTFEDQSIKSTLLTAIGTAQKQLGLYPQAKQAFESAYKTDSENMTTQLGLLHLQVLENDFATAEKQLDKLNQQLPDDGVDRAHWLLLKAQTLSAAKAYNEAIQLAQNAFDIFSSHQESQAAIEAARQVAGVMFQQSKHQQAASYLEKTLEDGLNHLSPTNTSILRLRNDLVGIYNDFGEYPKALFHSQELIDNIKAVLGNEHPFLILAYTTHAGTFRATGDIPKAEEFAQLALELSTSLYGEQHEATARAMNLKAVLAYVKGDVAGSLEQMQMVSKIYDQTLGEEHPDSWEIKTNLTALLNMNQQFDEAISIAEPLFQKQSEVLGRAHKATIYTQTILARLYSDVDRGQQALAMGEAMIEILNEEFEGDHPLTVGGYFTMAKIYEKLDKIELAIGMLEPIVKLDSWQDDNERVITLYNSLADLYLKNQQLQLAIKYKEKSLSVAINLLNETSPKTVAQMIKNIKFYRTIEHFPEADDLREKVRGVLAKDEQLAATFTSQLDQL